MFTAAGPGAARAGKDLTIALSMAQTVVTIALSSILILFISNEVAKPTTEYVSQPSS
ncbi:hypothetical protein GCM10017788_59680 [Amycolatopsis acidiphila]|nr:hypothetical protein GCM10017788_59680 [Amycolatopsis acidiphila]